LETVGLNPVAHPPLTPTSFPAGNASEWAFARAIMLRPKMIVLRRARIRSGRVDPSADHQLLEGPCNEDFGLTYLFIATIWL